MRRRVPVQRDAIKNDSELVRRGDFSLRTRAHNLPHSLEESILFTYSPTAATKGKHDRFGPGGDV